MATLNDTPTRAELVAAVLANPDALADCLTNAGIDPTAGREKFEKILTSFTPKPRKPGDSVTFKQNVKYFDTLIKPYFEQHNGTVTAAQIAADVDGLPTNAEGKTSTQKVNGILRTALTSGRISMLSKDDAKAWLKEHGIKGNVCAVYALA